MRPSLLVSGCVQPSQYLTVNRSIAPFDRGSRAHRGLILLFAFVVSFAAFGADKSATAPHGTLSVFAGGLSGQGYRDGAIADARFSYPTGMAIDKLGNLYVADSRNELIRKITPGGMVSTVAGVPGQAGSADGPGGSAEFNFPSDVAVDAAGNLYVADSGNNTIRKIDAKGVVTTLAGTAKQTGRADGAGAAARFNSPASLAIDASGNLYVVDSGNQTIRKVSSAGIVTTFAGKAGTAGSADGTGNAAQFNNPGSIAMDAAGNLYVADGSNCTVRKITPKAVVSTIAGTVGKSGSIDGPAATAQFKGSMGIVCDDAGNIYAADTFGGTIRKIDARGTVSTIAGWGSVTTAGAAARFSLPARIAIDQGGNLYVTDGNSQIRKITPASVVTTFAGTPSQSGSADGDREAARFSFTNGIVLARDGNLMVADMDNGTIRKITPLGRVTTFAGTAGKFGSANGTGAQAQFGGLGTLAMDAAGNFYVTEFYNNTIRKVTPGGVVTTFAGTSGKSGSADGLGAAAQFAGPNDIAADKNGNLYVADFWNNTVRKITPDGVVSTLAGSAGKAGGQDGAGSAARFDGPGGIAVDEQGNVYLTEMNNHTVRKITPGGQVSTVAGASGKPGNANGTGAEARFNVPWGIVVVRGGEIYVCDAGNNSIRRITPSGVVTTVAGGPGPYWNAPGTLPGKLAYPIGITADPKSDELYVSVPDAVLKVSFR